MDFSAFFSKIDTPSPPVINVFPEFSFTAIAVPCTEKLCHLVV